MQIELNPEIYERYSQVPWFQRCGQHVLEEFPFPVQPVTRLAEAIAAADSDQWTDANTLAQGDLTGYLSRTNYEAYGLNWNRLAREAQARTEKDILPRVSAALEHLGALELTDRVLLDLDCTVLHAAFRVRFPKVPEFFDHLFAVYQRGHLPCGWSGDFANWPAGSLMVF